MPMNIIILLMLGCVIAAPDRFLESEILNSNVAPIRCEIEMQSWCIATFNGSIQLSTEKNFRLWSLQHRRNMKAGPLQIIESDYCTARADEMPTLMHKKVLEDTKSRKSHSVKYQISKDGCTLEFKWPVTAIDDRSYQQTINFGILIGGNNKLTQLNEVQKYQQKNR